MANFQPQTVQNASTEDDNGGDIVVVGVREKSSVFSENRLSINPGGAWFQAYQGSTGGLSDTMPRFLRDLLNLPTTITIGEEFDARHVKLAQDAIQRLASLPQFKDAYAKMIRQNLDIEFHIVTRSDQIEQPSDFGNTEGKNLDGSVSDGSHIDIYINLNRLGEVITDRQFQMTIMHELIHAFGNPQWDKKLDDPGSTWSREIYNAAFSHAAEILGSSVVEGTGAMGGALQGTIDGAVLVGSQSSDDITTVSAGNTVFSGAGNDRISISVAGQSSIRDDGGYDTLVVSDASGILSLSARWSSDGQDVALYNDDTMIALLAGSATGGAFEAVQVGTTVVSLSSLMTGTNFAPSVQDQLIEVHGAHEGLIGSISSRDQDGDRLKFRMTEIIGAYSDRSWRITDDGKVFADFFRADMAGSEFTTIRVHVTDALSSSSIDLTVRWASNDSPYPELRQHDSYSWNVGDNTILESCPILGA